MITEEIKGLDEAADKYLDTQDVADMFCGDYEGWQIIDAFKAGAEWMAQRVKGTSVTQWENISITDGNPHNPSFIE